MKIFYSGPLTRWNTTEARRVALQELGHEVVPLDSLRILQRGPRVLTRLQWKVLAGPGVWRYNRALLTAVRDARPDLVWIDQGVGVWPTTVRAMKATTGARILHYTSDDIEKWTRLFRHYRRAALDYDIHVTTNPLNIPILKAMGAAHVVRAEFGYDPVLHTPRPLTDHDRRLYRAEVVFIGHWEPATEAQILRLRSERLPLRVWGGGWRKAANRAMRPTVDQCHHLEGEEYVKALAASKVSLCFLSKWNRNHSAGRTFEIPAIGRFLLAERTEDHLRYYDEGREAEFFGCVDELIDKCRHYLARDSAREAVARAGHERCLKSGYTNRNRVSHIVAQL